MISVVFLMIYLLKIKSKAKTIAASRTPAPIMHKTPASPGFFMRKGSINNAPQRIKAEAKIARNTADAVKTENRDKVPLLHAYSITDTTRKSAEANNITK